MKESILDTDIFSYITDNRYPEVLARGRQYIRAFGHYSVSAVTVTEVLLGYRSKMDDERAADFFKRLETCEVFPVDLEEAILAGEILARLMRAGQDIGPFDPFIAVTAIESERVLVTNNIKHYQSVVNLGFPLEPENWRDS
jgi:tRNA(fMet)-specific endonuclease VapC